MELARGVACAARGAMLGRFDGVAPGFCAERS
ncbi:hypothetical protein A2U01_0018371 [Trifolium medium]|uniref:Uncharacterized protein n=1 Tax=Trifolium medium TaxID=97028 RepID=A0A392NBY9_9FABA|nr:hypothetical protein [Trifolium medium]